MRQFRTYRGEFIDYKSIASIVGFWLDLIDSLSVYSRYNAPCPVPIKLVYDLDEASKLHTQNFDNKIRAVRNAWKERTRTEVVEGVCYRSADGNIVDGGDTPACYLLGVELSILMEMLERRAELATGTNSEGGLWMHCVRSILKLALYQTLIQNKWEGLGADMTDVLCWGYLPIEWKGQWPKGYAVAYCPPDSPYRELPPECVPTKEQLDAAKPLKWGKKPVLRAPEIDQAPVTVSDWLRALEHMTPAAALRKHWQAFADDEQAQRDLDAIADLVTDIRITGKQLIVEFPKTVTLGEPVFFRCAAGYDGPLDGLPASCARLQRVHNGIIGDGAAHMLAWYPWRKSGYPKSWDDIPWSEWHLPDKTDPDEPFPWGAPLVPFSSDGDLWCLLPRQERAPGEPVLGMMSHETSELEERVERSAPGQFLTAMREAVQIMCVE